MEIKKMALGDVKNVYELERQCFSDPWSEEALKAELENPYAVFFVAKKGDVLLGYCGIHALLDEADVMSIGVAPDVRKQGIGRKLVEELLNWCKNHNMVRLTLEVREGNVEARGLYGKLGFAVDGSRKNYYDNPVEAAILMSKWIGEESGNENIGNRKLL